MRVYVRVGPFVIIRATISWFHILFLRVSEHRDVNLHYPPFTGRATLNIKLKTDKFPVAIRREKLLIYFNTFPPGSR